MTELTKEYLLSLGTWRNDQSLSEEEINQILENKEKIKTLTEQAYTLLAEREEYRNKFNQLKQALEKEINESKLKIQKWDDELQESLSANFYEAGYNGVEDYREQRQKLMFREQIILQTLQKILDGIDSK